MQPDLFSESIDTAYTPRRVACFEPSRIVLARGWDRTASGRHLAEKILALSPDILPENCSDISHAKIPILETGLCLETHAMFETLGLQDALGRCNCVL